MVKKKTRAQIFMAEQLKDQEVAESFHDGLEELRLSINTSKKEPYEKLQILAGDST